jgi:hypothetical protein
MDLKDMEYENIGLNSAGSGKSSVMGSFEHGGEFLD